MHIFPNQRNILWTIQNHLLEKNLIRIPPTVHIPSDHLAHIFTTLLAAILEHIVDEHTTRCPVPRCTFGVDANLLHEIEAVNQYSKILEQNCVNFGIMDRIKRSVISFGVTLMDSNYIYS